MRLLLTILTLWFGSSSALDKVLQIDKTSRIKITNIDHFEIEVSGDTATLFDHFHLNILTSVGASQYQGNSVKGSTTKDKATFLGNLASVIPGAGAVQFIITQRKADDTPVSYGEKEFTLPVFPEADLSDAWVGDDSGIVSLRLADKSKVHGFQIGEAESAIDCKGSGTSCYFVGVEKEVTNPMEFCVAVDAILVCDKTIVIANEAFADVPVNELELKYPESGGNGEISIKPSSTKEIVVYMMIDTTVKQDTITVCYADPCDIGAYSPSTDIHQVLVVDTSEGPKKSKILEITDYELVATPLTSSLLEVRWTKRAGSHSHFWVTRDDPTRSGFIETSVTCEDSEGLTDGVDTMHCFGYFTTLTSDKDYEVSVNPSSGGTNDIKNNKVTLTGTHTPATPPPLSKAENSLELSSVNILWQNNLKHADISICFKHHDMTELSKYQAIFINKHGQSKRFNGAVRKSQDEACVSTTNFDVGSFHLNDLVTIVMVKRGQDGLSVLASDQTDVHFDELSGALAAENILQIKNHRTQEIFTKMMLSH